MEVVMPSADGEKTSEFWLSLGVVLLPLVLIVLNRVLDLGLPQNTLFEAFMAALAAVGVGYPVGRGLAKSHGSTTTLIGPQETTTVSTPTADVTSNPLPPSYNR
jgi:hypothetical protein